jgi:segregation and condensation protein A
MATTVSTPVFEGPVDLLLHLVNTHEVDILAVPLGPLVADFVAVVAETPERVAMDELSEFLLVAAILVELKSQRLLPGPDEVEADEELIGWEERDVLLGRLLECRAYGAAADVFCALTEMAARSVPREVGLDDGFVVEAPDLLAGVTPDRLAQAYLRAAAERPVPRVDLSHVTVDTMTVAEAVVELAAQLPGRGPLTFGELTAHLRTRIEVIVRFLALLELTKLGKVALGQGRTFGDLAVEWVADDRELVGVGSLVDDYDG